VPHIYTRALWPAEFAKDHIIARFHQLRLDDMCFHAWQAPTRSPPKMQRVDPVTHRDKQDTNPQYHAEPYAISAFHAISAQRSLRASKSGLQACDPSAHAERHPHLFGLGAYFLSAQASQAGGC